ncbi:MAG: PIN domain-containing protein [Nanoarchaeota archaeon]
MTDTNGFFLVDSNILVYAYDRNGSLRKKYAEELISKCFDNKISLAVSNQNLAEFVSVITKKAKLSFEQAKVEVKDLINSNGFIKINYSSKTILSAIDIANEFKMSFWDSLLAATMKENGIFNIYTENAKDFKMPWINAVNPFI